jgi:hypothetical protein
LFLVDCRLTTELAISIESSLGIVVEFTDRTSSRPSVELLASVVSLLPLDDESVAEELEAVELVVAALVDPLVDVVVELAGLKTPLETTPTLTTISSATTAIAAILEEIPLAAWNILNHLVNEVAGPISDYAIALLSKAAPSRASAP